MNPVESTLKRTELELRHQQVQLELHALDAQWRAQEEDLLVLVWAAGKYKRPSMVRAVVYVLTIVGVFQALAEVRAKLRYRPALRRYEGRRDELTAKIEAIESELQALEA